MKRPLSFLIVASFAFSSAFSQQGDVFDLSLEQLTRVRVTSATLSEQRVQDAPGAVSVITRQDIERMGFRTLWEVLNTIPGFQRVQNDDEQLITARGLYSTANQKMLVMRDGYAMNETVLDRFEVGYISLESIKKIEIIRGPSASLYGNSATSAVINIITDEADRSLLKVSGGNHGYTSMDGIFSHKLGEKSHLLLYGRLTNTQGQTYDRLRTDDHYGGSTHNGSAVVDQFPWNYDAGLRLKRGIFTLASSVRNYQQNNYWGSKGQVVRPDSLLMLPGRQSLMAYNELVILPVFKKEAWKARAQVYASYNQADVTTCANPDSSTVKGLFYPGGQILHREWSAIHFGVNGYASWQYNRGGNLLIGMQIERRHYLHSSYESNYLSSVYAPTVMVPRDTVFLPAQEMRNAVYVQWQQQLFSEKLMLNVGGRYDIPQNFDPTFNPRIALIYRPVEKVTLKGVYAQGFQAPAYLYRSSAPELGYGSTDKLNSEIMRSIQLIARYTFARKGYVELTGFQNQLSNLITRSGAVFVNLGQATIQGLEVDTRLDFKQFAVFGNATLLLPVAAATDSVNRERNIREGNLKHLSPLMATLGGVYRPTAKLSVNVYGQYYSRFYTGKNKEEIVIPSRFLLNATVVYRGVLKRIDFSASAYNLLNTQYVLGDRDTALLPQQGCWIQGGVTVHLESIKNAEKDL